MEMAKFIVKLGLKALASIIVLDSVMTCGAVLYKVGELRGQQGAKPFGTDEKEAEVKIE